MLSVEILIEALVFSFRGRRRQLGGVLDVVPRAGPEFGTGAVF